MNSTQHGTIDAPARRPPWPVRVAVALAAVGVGRWVLRPRRLVVEGDSMRPTLLPGDRLVVTRALRVRRGDLVAVPDPRLPARLLLKRVSDRRGEQVTVAGDNPVASTDSRTFGPVRRSAVVGKVRYRYAPAGRVGSADRRPATRPR